MDGRTKVPLCSTGLHPLRGRCPKKGKKLDSGGLSLGPYILLGGPGPQGGPAGPYMKNKIRKVREREKKKKKRRKKKRKGEKKERKKRKKTKFWGSEPRPLYYTW